jgi:peptidoglycan/xylan/chitin deacetylase (PgdA/CDA1 family)
LTEAGPHQNAILAVAHMRTTIEVLASATEQRSVNWKRVLPALGIVLQRGYRPPTGWNTWLTFGHLTRAGRHLLAPLSRMATR